MCLMTATPRFESLRTGYRCGKTPTKLDSPISVKGPRNQLGSLAIARRTTWIRQSHRDNSVVIPLHQP